MSKNPSGQMTERERRAYNRGLEHAARAALFYANENMRLATETLLHCPVLSGRARTREDLKLAHDLTDEGFRHSAAYHAGLHIAHNIVSMKEKPKHGKDRPKWP